jgi:Predicted small integral membrane protein (DUF2165)
LTRTGLDWSDKYPSIIGRKDDLSHWFSRFAVNQRARRLLKDSGGSDAMMIERRLKILMIGGVAVLSGFIVAGSIHDPDLNYSFVQHVLRMDTVVPASGMVVRAMPIPLLWRMAFWLIVLGEPLTAASFA